MTPSTNLQLNDFTELELLVLNAIFEGNEFNETPTQCFEDLKDITQLSNNQLKGVLGSLYKKEAYHEGEYPNGMTAYHLADNFYNLLINQTEGGD